MLSRRSSSSRSSSRSSSSLLLLLLLPLLLSLLSLNAVPRSEASTAAIVAAERPGDEEEEAEEETPSRSRSRSRLSLSSGERSARGTPPPPLLPLPLLEPLVFTLLLLFPPLFLPLLLLLEEEEAGEEGEGRGGGEWLELLLGGSALVCCCCFFVSKRKVNGKCVSFFAFRTVGARSQPPVASLAQQRARGEKSSSFQIRRSRSRSPKRDHDGGLSASSFELFFCSFKKLSPFKTRSLSKPSRLPPRKRDLGSCPAETRAGETTGLQPGAAPSIRRSDHRSSFLSPCSLVFLFFSLPATSACCLCCYQRPQLAPESLLSLLLLAASVRAAAGRPSCQRRGAAFSKEREGRRLWKNPVKSEKKKSPFSLSLLFS